MILTISISDEETRVTPKQVFCLKSKKSGTSCRSNTAIKRKYDCQIISFQVKLSRKYIYAFLYNRYIKINCNSYKLIILWRKVWWDNTTLFFYKWTNNGSFMMGIMNEPFESPCSMFAVNCRHWIWRRNRGRPSRLCL